MKCFSNQLRNSTAGYILRKKRRGAARKEGNEMVLLFKQQQRAFCCHKLKEVKNERERLGAAAVGPKVPAKIQSVDREREGRES